jgi:predicted transcriptional regulator of viral defense system
MTLPREPGYSQSRGIKLLESALQDDGPIITLAQLKAIASRQRLSATHLRFLVSSLARAGWIEILKRGVYVVKSPLYAGEISPFAIAAALVQPIAISHWSACSYHGFTTQTSTMVQASTPARVITPEMRKGSAHSPRGRAVWQAHGSEFEFIHVKPQAFWGIEQVWVNSSQPVSFTDRERTALDLTARPDIFGGFASAVEILEAALPLIQPDRLIAYALKLGVGSVIKRLGWALEKLGVSAVTLDPLRNYPVKRYYALDPRHPAKDRKDPAWHIYENLAG